jgi:hypothetical protein
VKAVCKRKCQFRGRTVKPGEEFDILPREATDLVRASFVLRGEQDWDAPAAPVATENAPAATGPQSAPEDRSGLTIDELRRRLAEFGVAYKARDSRDTLMALYLAQVNQTTGE